MKIPFKRICAAALCLLLTVLMCGCRDNPTAESSLSEIIYEEIIIEEESSSEVSSLPESSVPEQSTPQVTSSEASSAPEEEYYEEEEEPVATERVGIKPRKIAFEDKATTADPHVFKDDDGKLYMYCTELVVYSANSMNDVWTREKIKVSVPNKVGYWAPCMYKENGVYYLYFSCGNASDSLTQDLYVAQSSSPLGPFENVKKLYSTDEFRIDPQVVKTDSGLYIFYSRNKDSGAFRGTRICIDSMSDPVTVNNKTVDILEPSEYEEISIHRSLPWYTLEGAFYVEKDGWRYLMYSANAYEQENYHIGYATAPADGTDFMSAQYVKHKGDDGTFDPLMCKGSFEEGTGHHSVVEIDGEYYMFYHGRDLNLPEGTNMAHARTVRICKLHFNNGVITAESIAN